MMERNIIPLFRPFIAPRAELLPALEATLYSGRIAEGPRVAEFEQAFGKFIGNPNCVAVSSCTAALHLALSLAGVKPGDSVISTAMTAEPTNLAILHAGGRIVWADVEAGSGNASRRGLVLASMATRPVPNVAVVVDYGGVPVDVPALASFMDSGVVIEDAAHALGATLNGRQVGNLADYVCFSFQSIKHISTGDGGMLVCQNPDDVARAKRLRWFSIDRNAPRTEMDISEIGYKYNMNDITAAIGLVQLRHAAEVVEAHRVNAAFFDAAFRDVPGLETVKPPPNSNPSWWFYTLLTDRRDELEAHLQAKGVQCGRVHRRNDWHSVFKASNRPLPGLELFWNRMLHIPCGWWLTDEDRERIVEAIMEWAEGRR